ncbi:GDSL-type esterase/lipase family protein [Luteolibacter sp. SL250]|uniref:GDSL-type esterase/lipase family protein n=1 Tax=Luteolibacter sp. SL250 TaxID=2995170 RepID=UPI002270D466|nr:GDSL-type esterase/lipase family protein [Luteolibacter sp. SL250]WAC20745.1 GDSL-type esterase/lipase family protein [Luteolibacter sp. SL250]
MNPRSILAAAVCTLCGHQHASATLFAYDGFDYQSVAEGQTLVGVNPALQSAGSSGIGSTITGASAAGQGGTSNIYQSSGLTLGSLQVRGGRGRYKNTAGAASFMGYQYLGPTLPAGSTFYTSHLVRLEMEKTVNSVISLRMNASNTSGAGDSFFVTYADTGSTNSLVATQYGKSSVTPTTTGTGALELGPTYLVIGKFTNAGVSGTRTATTYILNEAQFTNYADGGFGEAEWDAVTTFGTGADQLVGRATQTYSGATIYNLNNGGGIQFGIGNAGSPGQDVSFDEMRCASTLAEVTPTGPPPPEPDPVLVSLTVVDAVATEPTAPAPLTGRFQISRQDTSIHQVTIPLAVSGTAKNGRDFHIPTSVLMPANINTIIIEVKPAADREVEPDETVILTLQPGSGHILGSGTTGTVTIQDGPPGTRSQLIENLSAGIPQKLVVYGTSLTEAGAWTSQVKAGLDAAYPGMLTLINSGGRGQNSLWGKNNLTTKVINQLDPDLPGTVMIEFAVNDAVIRTSYHSVITPAQARANLDHMLDRIRTERPYAEVILQVMNPVINVPSNPEGATHRPNLALCQQNYRDAGKERGLMVIDHMPAWQALLDQGASVYDDYVGDGLHPGSNGYQLFVTPVILRELGATNQLTSGTVMLRADNQRTAEPLAASGAPRSSKITLTRGGPTTSDLTVSLTLGGTATNGTDHGSLPISVVIPAGADSASLDFIPLPDSLAEGEETFTIGISAGAGYTLASPNKASLLIEDLPFDHWRKSRFTAADLLDPLVSGDNADPDHDGIANLLEFLTNHGPKSADHGGAAIQGTESISGQTYLTLTYDCVTGNGLTDLVQTSVDLSTWRDGAGFVEETELSDTGLIRKMKARSLVPIGGGKEFIRLKAVREP